MAFNRYVSNVYLYGAVEEKGYPIDEVTVTIQSGMQSGSVLRLDAGKYIWVDAANVANASAVLADERADDPDAALPAGDHTLKVIRRAAGVGREYLIYSGSTTQANRDAAEAALLALGIKAENQY